MKIFIFGSCRIHRPFNNVYNKYNCLETLWYKSNFIGSVYCSNYILMIIKILLSRNLLEKDKLCYPYDITDEHFYNLCDSLTQADTIIVEIATIKYRKLPDRYLSNEEIHRYSNFEAGIIEEGELSKNIIEIQDIIQKSGKQVLFVSHFHVNIKMFDRKLIGRKLIIDCLSKHAKYFFNPTSIVQSNISNNIVDYNHYSNSCEVLIMEELDKHLKIIQSGIVIL